MECWEQGTGNGGEFITFIGRETMNSVYRHMHIILIWIKDIIQRWLNLTNLGDKKKDKGKLTLFLLNTLVLDFFLN